MYIQRRRESLYYDAPLDMLMMLSLLLAISVGGRSLQYLPVAATFIVEAVYTALSFGVALNEQRMFCINFKLKRTKLVSWPYIHLVIWQLYNFISAFELPGWALCGNGQLDFFLFAVSPVPWESWWKFNYFCQFSFTPYTFENSTMFNVGLKQWDATRLTCLVKLCIKFR